MPEVPLRVVFYSRFLENFAWFWFQTLSNCTAVPIHIPSRSLAFDLFVVFMRINHTYFNYT